MSEREEPESSDRPPPKKWSRNLSVGLVLGLQLGASLGAASGLIESCGQIHRLGTGWEAGAYLLFFWPFVALMTMGAGALVGGAAGACFGFVMGFVVHQGRVATSARSDVWGRPRMWAFVHGAAWIVAVVLLMRNYDDVEAFVEGVVTGEPSEAVLARHRADASPAPESPAAPTPPVEPERPMVAPARQRLADPPLGDGTLPPEGMVRFGADPMRNLDAGVAAPTAAFSLDRTEVTASAYESCVLESKCERPRVGGACTFEVAVKGDHPINCVTWQQAKAYCEQLGKRLPTEAEWEWAARVFDDGPRADVRPLLAFPWGSTEPVIADDGLACWRRRTPRAGTCPVAEHGDGAAPRGVMDLAGNVWEWTSTEAAEGRRVRRGGSWRSVTSSELRVGSRAVDRPSSSADDVGVRCAQD